MLGVLMAGAKPGQDQPDARETADLLIGAVQIRFRPGGALSDRSGWRDAFAVCSLAAPVLVLASACMALLAAEVWSIRAHSDGLTRGRWKGADAADLDKSDQLLLSRQGWDKPTRPVRPATSCHLLRRHQFTG
jgi:hypothetical protein